MKDTELKKQRDRDLYAAYVEGLRTRTFSSLGEAAEYARKQKAPQYYISARAASLLIGKIQGNISLIDVHENSRRRIWDLYEKFQEHCKNNPDSKESREIIFERLVETPAPEFFLTNSRAKHIIMEERRKRRSVMRNKGHNR